MIKMNDILYTIGLVLMIMGLYLLNGVYFVVVLIVLLMGSVTLGYIQIFKKENIGIVGVSILLLCIIGFFISSKLLSKTNYEEILNKHNTEIMSSYVGYNDISVKLPYCYKFKYDIIVLEQDTIFGTKQRLRVSCTLPIDDNDCTYISKNGNRSHDLRL